MPPLIDLRGPTRAGGGVERRMLAHMETLAIGGPRVAHKILLPALQDQVR